MTLILLLIHKVIPSAEPVWNNRQCAPSGKHQVWGRCSRIRVAQRQPGDALAVKGESITNCAWFKPFKCLHATFWCFFFCLAMQLLGIPTQVLQQGLTHRKIEAKTEEVSCLPLLALNLFLAFVIYINLSVIGAQSLLCGPCSICQGCPCQSHLWPHFQLAGQQDQWISR